MQVTLKMPDHVARQWGETPDAVSHHIMEDAAIEGYRAGRFSRRQVGELLGLDYWQTEAFLKDRGVPLNYSTEDLEADRVTLDKSSAARERRRLRHLTVTLGFGLGTGL